MLFTSIEFLLFFLPVVLLINFIIPRKLKNCWLLFASLFFYAWGEPDFVLILLFSIVFNFVMALVIDRQDSNITLKKIALMVAVFVNLGILAVFKYMIFIVKTLHDFSPATKESLAIPDIALPIGISFFTFQALSYVIDVYKRIPAQKNIVNLGLYISFFPQLIAGPIVRYNTIMDQISNRKVTLDMFSKGVIRFLEGFSKKIILANTFAVVTDTAFSSNPNNSVCMAWLGAVCYTLQIYFDFSGYSDMAIGLGQMFGFRFLENFNYPYISKTVTEFWRRWHISLGNWFRDYVYLPIGGSRVKTKRRMIFNLLFVWLLTGIWHGANWTFVAWGVLYGIIITYEKLADIPDKMKCYAMPLRSLYCLFTIMTVILGWVLFRSDSLTNAVLYLKTMFGASNTVFADGVFWFNFREYGFFLVAGIICSTPVFKVIKNKMNLMNPKVTTIADGCYYAFQLGLFVISFSFLVMKAHSPFIYFNF